MVVKRYISIVAYRQPNATTLRKFFGDLGFRFFPTKQVI